jgi:hypothetical protein
MRVLPTALVFTVAAAAAQAQEPAAADGAARAESILAREETRGRPFSPAFRAVRKALLAAASEEQLALVERRGAGLLPEPSVLGEAPRHLVLNPVPPCRIIDTRVAGGALAAGAPRDFHVAGTVDFEAQGGVPGGCGVPLGEAAAVVINFVAVAPAGPGNLRAWPFGAAVPGSSVINYAAVGLNIANGLVLPLCRPDVVTCTHDLSARADVNATHLVADVLGYFVPEQRSRVRQGQASSGGSPIPTTCANTGGVAVTLAVSDTAGSVTLRGTAAIEMLHFNSQDDEVKAFIGTTPTDCSAAASTSRIPAVLPSFLAAPGMWVELNPVRVEFVGPGVYTYYLNFQNTGVGTGNDRFRQGHLEAVFHPSN